MSEKTNINKKMIQKRRMMSYFIQAAHQIIEQEGLESITIRKVSDIAGYNSATLYNYFKDLEHLIFFTSMKYLKDYALRLPECIRGYENSYNKYLKVWKCFCAFSFSNPKIYHILFFYKYSSSLDDAIEEYYQIFPEELVTEHTEELLPMLLKQNIYERNKALLRDCITEGFIASKDIDPLNDMTLLLYQGMLSRILDFNEEMSIEDYVDLAIKYIMHIFKSFSNKS